MAREYLFFGIEYFDVREAQIAAIKNEVQTYEANRLLNTSTDDLCGYFEAKFQIDIPTLREAEAVIGQRETQIDVSRDPLRFIEEPSQPFYVPGTAVELRVPFDGDPDAFKIKPTTFTLSPPVGRVEGSNLLLVVQGTDLTPEKVKATLDRSLQEIREWLGHLRQDLQELNGIVASTVRAAVESRKTKLLSDRNLVSSLGYRIQSREGTPGTYAAPEIKRRIEIHQPTASSAPFAPEPTIVDADYDQILHTINNMSTVMERSPSAFAKMDEEALRFHFLVQLNAMYQGQATGETFNYSGKTDILVRSGGKNIFIAECKYWGGPKILTQTIDQILSYSSWRDTKVAIIIFNRRKDFSQVLKSIEDTVRAHPNCKRLLRKDSESVFRFLFAHKDDPNREMYLTSLAFDVPAGQEST